MTDAWFSTLLVRMRAISLPMLIAMVILGCNNARSSNDTLSVNENSLSRPVLVDKIDFIERYLSFDREYEALEYQWFHSDNSGGLVPGPSDWNYQLLAIVPPEEVEQWQIETVEPVNVSPPSWVREIPGDIPTEGITEWYVSDQKVVGLDRDLAIVAYWISSEIIPFN